MPYKNIVFVKLYWGNLLHGDDRFIEQLNDEQKGLYLMLLLLAGATQNNIKDDPKYLKRTLNLAMEEQKIAENVMKITHIFKKFKKKDGFLKFTNFKRIHNFIGKPLGNTKDALDKSRIEENREDKNRIEAMLSLFKEKHKETTGVPYLPNYGKDKILLREFLSFEEKDMVSLINEFFNSAKDSSVWWADKLSIGVFKVVVPKLLGRLRKR